GHDLRYEAILAEPETFRETVLAFAAAGGRGMNVTAPFKLAAAELADTLTERARAAGAVNTLKFDPDGILGDNTDGVGLVGDIQDRLGVPLAGRRILVIGAGGATRGILLPLLQARPAGILVVNRTAARAEALAHALEAAGRVRGGPLEAAGGQEYDVVIHATSAGPTPWRMARTPRSCARRATGARPCGSMVWAGSSARRRNPPASGAACGRTCARSWSSSSWPESMDAYRPARAWLGPLLMCAAS